MMGRSHSKQARAKMSNLKTGEQNPKKRRIKFGLQHSEEIRAKQITAKKEKCQKIKVTDLTQNQITIYDSIRAAGRALDINHSRITVYFKQNQKSRQIYFQKSVELL